MKSSGISAVIGIVVVAVLLVAVGVGYYVLVPRSGGTTSSTSSSASSSSSLQAVVCTQSQSATGNVIVTIADFSFSPSSITVKAGQSVQWVYSPSGNTQHEVASNTQGLFQSSAMSPGTKFTCTFNEVGVFGYHCAFHPAAMKGNVTVT